MNYVRRFVFVHYEDLLEVRFRQLEKVTDKLYVFVPGDVEQVPFWLVRQVQTMGRDLAWVDTGSASYDDAQLLLAFRIGTLHEQVDPGVEFAILSDAPEIDALVDHLRQSGRECLRIKPKPQPTQAGAETAAGALRQDRPMASASESAGIGFGRVDFDDLNAYLAEVDDESEDLDAEYGAPFGKTANDPTATSRANHADTPAGAGATSTRREQRHRRRSGAESGVAQSGGDWSGRERATGPKLRDSLQDNPSEAELLAAVMPLADDVVRKLIRSGNRPKDLSMLRSYILLYSEEAKAGRHVEEIIRVMGRKGEITVDGAAVKYSF